MDSFGDLCRMPHHFLWYAANVHAGAAEIFRFDYRAFLAIHGRTVDGGDTAAAAADGKVVIMSGHRVFRLSESLSHQAILFAILNQGSAQNPHVLRVRSGSSALSVSKLAATMTPGGTDSE